MAMFTVGEYGATVFIETNDVLIHATFSIIIGECCICMKKKVGQGYPYRIVSPRPIFNDNLLRVSQRTPKTFGDIL